MTNEEIRYRGNGAQLRRELLRIPAILAGKEPDPYGYTDAVVGRLGNAVLGTIQLAFIAKSRGGTDESGLKWAPLKRETIAQRRIGPGTAKAQGLGGKRERGLLTPTQNKRWKAIYGSRVGPLMLQLGPAAGRAMAAKIAWSILKKEGAKTRLEVLGNRQVEILRDTGVLFNSLSPGVESTPSSAEGQVFRLGRGGVVVGTNVPYAAPQHARRRLWPEPANFPASWMTGWANVLARGIAQVLPTHLASAFRGRSQ